MQKGITHQKDEARNLSSRRTLLKALAGLSGGYAASQLLAGSKLFASPAASSVPGSATANLNIQTIHYDSGDSQIEAYLATPKDDAKHPAVIVIHDDGGLNENIRGMARRFAAEGFVALAPDLLSRTSSIAKTNPDEISKALSQLSVEGSVQDLQKGYSFLRSNPNVDPKSISSVGFGWGGYRNLLLAGSVDDLRGAVMFCGSTPSDGLRDIEASILAHYAQFDFRVTGNALWTAKTMKDLGKQFTYYVYPNVGRDFFNDARSEYDAEEAKLAWKRTMEFLKSLTQ
jgi:carboxymethylenebutenolidase